MATLSRLERHDPMTASGKQAYLVVSDEAHPALPPKPKFEVRTVQIVDPKLNPSNKVAARLCGDTSTCVALIEIE
jgi:hypothetical protein